MPYRTTCIHLSLLATKRRIPIIPIVLLYAAVLAYFDLNDDHNIREFAATPAVVGRPDAGKAFLNWLDKHISASARSSNTKDEDSAKPYSVFIVAAQGGGIYAAFNTAVFLSRMEDLCPDFHNHIFAISSVSAAALERLPSRQLLMRFEGPFRSQRALLTPAPVSRDFWQVPTQVASLTQLVPMKNYPRKSFQRTYLRR
jgi:hypothetical protein